MNTLRILLVSTSLIAASAIGCGGQTASGVDNNSGGGPTPGGGGTSAGGGSSTAGNSSGGTAQGGTGTGGHAGSGTAGTSQGGTSSGGASQGGASQGGTSNGGAGGSTCHAVCCAAGQIEVYDCKGTPPPGCAPQFQACSATTCAVAPDTCGGQGGAGGGVPACCTSSAACPAGEECVSNNCLPAPPPGECWSNTDCPPGGGVCNGASVCPCGVSCGGPDQIGKCGPAGACCATDADCGDFAPGECIGGVCKTPLGNGQCWRDTDCGPGLLCFGASVCPCGAVCNQMDTPGTCQGGSGGAGGGPPTGCCNSNADCGPNTECVNTICEPLPPPGACWSNADCNVPGGPPMTCQGAMVCSCLADCIGPDQMGKCVAQAAGACPAQQPQFGQPCTGAATCEYGDDIRLNCRTHAYCQNGAWTIAVSGCPPLPGPGVAGCPSDAGASGTMCSTQGELCDEGMGAMCDCGACSGPGPCMVGPGGTNVWSCLKPPAAPCPAIAPDLGQACSIDPSVFCSYGYCGDGVTGTARGCQNGVWTDLGQVCPL